MTDNEEVRKLTFDEAVAMLPSEDHIHTYLNPAGMMLGAEWTRASVLDLLRTGDPELSGDLATDIGHGIVAWKEGRPVFIETRPASNSD